MMIVSNLFIKSAQFVSSYVHRNCEMFKRKFSKEVFNVVHLAKTLNDVRNSFTDTVIHTRPSSFGAELIQLTSRCYHLVATEAL